MTRMSDEHVDQQPSQSVHLSSAPVLARHTGPDPVRELLCPARAGSLRSFLGLPVRFNFKAAESAVKRRVLWAQARVHHPKYKVLAQSILIHREALRHRALQCAGPALSELVECTLSSFWKGLCSTAGLNPQRRYDLLQREALRVGLDPDRIPTMVLRGSPELGKAVGQALGLGGEASAEVGRSLASNRNVGGVLLGLTALRLEPDTPTARRRSEALVDLADGIRGLLLQRALSPTSQESLVRVAYHGGVAPHRARDVCQLALREWMAFRSGDRDAYAVLGPGSAHTQRLRYLRRRRLLVTRVSKPGDLRGLVRLDAAWTSLAS
ncbi:MAG: hypothetical protein ACI9VR_000986 [Cognaticolwellia sp.]|jgi:hypothetical protein